MKSPEIHPSGGTERLPSQCIIPTPLPIFATCNSCVPPFQYPRHMGRSSLSLSEGEKPGPVLRRASSLACWTFRGACQSLRMLVCLYIPRLVLLLALLVQWPCHIRFQANPQPPLPSRYWANAPARGCCICPVEQVVVVTTDSQPLCLLVWRLPCSLCISIMSLVWVSDCFAY